MSRDACHWTGRTTPRALGPDHQGPHDQCRPCPDRHCRDCNLEHVTGTVVRPDGETVNVQTCPRCIGATRADLADLATLHALLPDQAIHHAAAAIPGGNAAVMLAPAGALYARQQARAVIAAVDAAAAIGQVLTDADLAAFTRDESSADPEPPLLTLATWEDDFRAHRDDSEGPRATVNGSVAYLSRVLHEVAQTHDGYSEFVSDIRHARAALELTLLAGNRAHEGARCLSDDCGALLRQPYARPERCKHSTPARRELAMWLGLGYPEAVGPAMLRAAARPCERTGCDQGGRRDDWRCPACKRRYSDEDYRRAVAQEHAEASPLRTAAEVARTLSVQPGRVRLWAHRGQIAKVATDKRGRPLYDIREVRRAAMASGLAS